ATSGTRLAMVKESGPMRLNRIWGESVTFSPVVPTGTWVTNIVWNAKTIIAIVVPGKQASLTVIDQSYTERLRVSDGSHSLEITHLSQEDTGTYTAQITIQGMTKPILQRFALHMYSKSRMEISDSVLTVNGMCNVTLHCTLQGGGEDVSYTWNQIAESTVVSSEGSIFISHRLRSGVSPVTCTARNPVSSSSKSISLQEFCEGDILQQQVLLAIILAGTAWHSAPSDSGTEPPDPSLPARRGLAVNVSALGADLRPLRTGDNRGPSVQRLQPSTAHVTGSLVK
uniref:Ig-like domain-containing protein n=1 Tax=Chelonoidis abingdonii TaxID=106734 RepID=A0A8C0IXE4_CHEAB